MATFRHPDGQAHRPEIWLVRHGQTEWSRDGKHTSSTDLPLTPDGERAARSLAPKLADAAFDLVLSSPRRRARVTAQLAGFAPEIDDDLREWDYGEYEGITTPQIRETDPGWSLWTDGAPGGERPEDVEARVDRLIERLRSAPGERVLVFAHGHILRVVAARWTGWPVAAGGHLRLDTATVSVLGWERETPAIHRWNAP
ncbi:histidine phosphatase family protein [Jiangella rhizosphaerae]|uniref:Histidine phosphatase family protein n=1 Tax=Jiangella rhizosphaerae TaxID=2293569 RepID=A0A418KJ26_9ACTN|nr:histidine phosphatase family protein [Jiangella rhizosphaerae]RIQ14363.1 histidine phosphatase family protein [Jiangella rhizosphaerae]